MIDTNLFSVDGDKVVAGRPFIAWCGCGTAGRKIEKIFARAEVRLAGIPMARSTSNRNCKRYIEQEGYKELFPSLKKATHAILIDPASRSGVDLISGGEQATIKSIRKLLGVL